MNLYHKLSLIRDHANAVMKIHDSVPARNLAGQNIPARDGLPREALDLFLKIHPDSPLKKLMDE